MNWIGMFGVLLCAAFLSLTLRGQRPELAMGIGLAAGVLVLWTVLEQVTPLLGTLRRLVASAGISASHFAVVLKAMGMGLLTQMTADTCRDAGESALAGKAELAGRVFMLLLSVPLFEELLAMVVGMMEGQGGGG